MNLVFIPVVVALTGLFGLMFALYGVLTNKIRGGRTDKQQPRQPSKGSSSGNQKTFHHCTTPGCKINLPGQDPHGQCFTCQTLDHDMNICGPCLTSPADAQQCRAIILFLWNCEPRSQPLPVLTVSKGIMRLLPWVSPPLASQFEFGLSGSTSLVPSCDYIPFNQEFRYSGLFVNPTPPPHPPPPPPTGWQRSLSLLGRSEEGTGSARQQTSSAMVVSSVQATFADSQLSSVSNLSSSLTAGPLSRPYGLLRPFREGILVRLCRITEI